MLCLRLPDGEARQFDQTRTPKKRLSGDDICVCFVEMTRIGRVKKRVGREAEAIGEQEEGVVASLD